MKSDPIQHIFAKGWPLKVWVCLTPVVMTALAVQMLEPSNASFTDWTYIMLFAFCLLIAPVLGFFVGIPVGMVVLGPCYFIQAKRNGAPFKPGDRVRILSGPSQGQVTRIYSFWQGDTLRVELGPENAAIYKDIFSPTQLAREPNKASGGPVLSVGAKPDMN